MKIALDSDEANELTMFLIDELGQRGHSMVLRGPIDPADPDVDWPLTSDRERNPRRVVRHADECRRGTKRLESAVDRADPAIGKTI